MRFVIVGGGVSAVCCAEELCLYRPDDAVVLVSADRVLKGVKTVSRLTRHAEELQVEEKDLESLPYKNLSWVQGIAVGVDTTARRLLLADGDPIAYDKLCVCTGARPKRLATDSPHVLTLRDTESVEALRARLPAARRVMVVGNGGIALELIHALRGVEVVWAMRHGHIGDAFFDLDAAQYLLEEMQGERAQQPAHDAEGPAAGSAAACKPEARPGGGNSGAEGNSRATFRVTQGGRHGTLGHAVGPTWAADLPTTPDAVPSHVTLEYGCEVSSIEAGPSGDGPVAVRLSNGAAHSVDFVVAALGVVPAVEWLPPEVRRAADGGLEVDSSMETSAAGVYAAGDACSAPWALAASPHWFQMRLWSQARASAVYAAHCMAGVQDDTGSDMAFELFTHVTRFMGKKVVLLGLYNGQRLEHEPAEDVITYCRVGEPEEYHVGGGCCGGRGRTPGGAPGRTFVRVLLLRGRVQGAVLIGETGLEEVFENLILDALDVGQYGPHLLDPEVELDHVFD